MMAITFEQFLEIEGEDSEMELVDGVLVERNEVDVDHELLFGWLIVLLNGFVSKRGLGIVLGSRSAVEISELGGRMPDLLFVSSPRTDIVRQKAIYGAPDLVIEIPSPHDRPSDTLALETDYRSIGVREIVFIDPQKKRVLAIRKREHEYEAAELTSGELAFETVPGFHIDLAWIFAEERPNEVDILLNLLGG